MYTYVHVCYICTQKGSLSHWFAFCPFCPHLSRSVCARGLGGSVGARWAPSLFHSDLSLLETISHPNAHSQRTQRVYEWACKSSWLTRHVYLSNSTVTWTYRSYFFHSFQLCSIWVSGTFEMRVSLRLFFTWYRYMSTILECATSAQSDITRVAGSDYSGTS